MLKKILQTNKIGIKIMYFFKFACGGINITRLYIFTPCAHTSFRTVFLAASQQLVHTRLIIVPQCKIQKYLTKISICNVFRTLRAITDTKNYSHRCYVSHFLANLVSQKEETPENLRRRLEVKLIKEVRF